MQAVLLEKPLKIRLWVLMEGMVFGGYVSFLESFALPNVGLFNVIVPWGEFLVGLGLILGCLTTAAAFFGMVMNFSFLMAGTVSHNPTDILMGFFIITAGYNAGKFGLDRYVLPYLRKLTNKGKDSHSRSAAKGVEDLKKTSSFEIVKRFFIY